MIINSDGTYLVIGAFDGSVVKIDENLATFTSSKFHQATVKFMFTIYTDYYISIGDDNKIVLWNAGAKLDSINSLSSDQLNLCGVFRQG